MSDVTRILQSVDSGDPKAVEELLPLVYDELRRLAAVKMARENPGQTLQATALVHEAWIRLSGSQGQSWEGRTHFFSAAAEAMRRILIDQARRKARIKHGAGQPADALHESRIEMEVPSEEVLAVDEALNELEEKDSMAAEVVKLRYFAGMNLEEVGKSLGISRRSAGRHWAYARSWLRGAIRRNSSA